MWHASQVDQVESNPIANLCGLECSFWKLTSGMLKYFRQRTTFRRGQIMQLSVFAVNPSTIDVIAQLCESRVFLIKMMGNQRKIKKWSDFVLYFIPRHGRWLVESRPSGLELFMHDCIPMFIQYLFYTASTYLLYFAFGSCSFIFIKEIDTELNSGATESSPHRGLTPSVSQISGGVPERAACLWSCGLNVCGIAGIGEGHTWSCQKGKLICISNIKSGINIPRSNILHGSFFYDVKAAVPY